MCISLFLCSLSPNATNKKIRNRFADVKFYYYLCAVYELFNQITLIKMKKTIVMTLALLLAGCWSAGAQSIYHVSRENGSNKNDGSKTAPFKNMIRKDHPLKISPVSIGSVRIRMIPPA